MIAGVEGCERCRRCACKVCKVYEVSASSKGSWDRSRAVRSGGGIHPCLVVRTLS